MLNSPKAVKLYCITVCTSKIIINKYINENY